MRVVVEEEEAEVMYPSTPGKVKVEQRSSAAMSRQVHRCFASTGTMFLWALFLVAMTATYLSFRSLAGDAAASSSRYFPAASWGGLHWERQIRASASPRRPPGSAEGAGLSVLVTGAAGFAEAVTCGRGDKKTKRGKRFKGSYGNARPKREKKIERIKDRVEVPRSTPWPLPFKLI
uniref:30S ribosomal protein S31, mitochondrial n=1 Tax=Oryza barthii TaxID=65489 RepID=A0A0D3H979_9ORYZ